MNRVDLHSNRIRRVFWRSLSVTSSSKVGTFDDSAERSRDFLPFALFPKRDERDTHLECLRQNVVHIMHAIFRRKTSPSGAYDFRKRTRATQEWAF